MLVENQNKELFGRQRIKISLLSVEAKERIKTFPEEIRKKLFSEIVFERNELLAQISNSNGQDIKIPEILSIFSKDSFIANPVNFNNQLKEYSQFLKDRIKQAEQTLEIIEKSGRDVSKFREEIIKEYDIVPTE